MVIGYGQGSYYVGHGGAGNPGGSSTKKLDGMTSAQNGTGGLLVIWAESLNKLGTLVARRFKWWRRTVQHF